ncbi:hypothetical protein TIFTF001_021716 [Ficus carica]|uniref:Uncharacterized protein n=1 Tax=Ficus carica TaxID=3494 RepID=A0AA88AGG0_FICCA|nr:hypothetical protein TIFTF001_021716 [Ficus carica]
MPEAITHRSDARRLSHSLSPPSREYPPSHHPRALSPPPKRSDPRHRRLSLPPSLPPHPIDLTPDTTTITHRSDAKGHHCLRSPPPASTLSLSLDTKWKRKPTTPFSFFHSPMENKPSLLPAPMSSVPSRHAHTSSLIEFFSLLEI